VASCRNRKPSTRAPGEDPALADPERQDVIGESPGPPVFFQGIDVTFIPEGA
jgi:hypothetical protein